MVPKSISRWDHLTALNAGILLAIIAILSVNATGSETFVPMQAEPYQIAECPTHWEYLPKRLGGRIGAAGLPLADAITDVPEFHDCQRLITRDGLTFGPLVAIFASYELDDLERYLTFLETGRDTTRQLPEYLYIARSQRKTALAAALIVNVDQLSYDPLRIRPGFSCLYVWRRGSNQWYAGIAPVDSAEKCTHPAWPDSLPVSNLQVRRDVVRGGVRPESDPYPPVVRWDRDPQSGDHYIAIKCGRAFCEIGRSGFAPSRMHVRRDPQTTGDYMRRVKGWYDEQLLAIVDSLGRTVPSRLTGTVFPDSMLERRTIESFTGTFITVSYIALSDSSTHYKRMLNLDAAPPDGPFSAMNRLSLCVGTRAACAVPDTTHPPARLARCDPDGAHTEVWWVRIDAARGGDPMYRCVLRTGHETLRDGIPATARWRWLAHDETVWQECVEGCCKVSVDES